MHRSSYPLFTMALLSSAFSLGTGCASGVDDAATPITSAAAGGPVQGPPDQHCVGPGGQRIVHAVKSASCKLPVLIRPLPADAGTPKGDAGGHLSHDAGKTASIVTKLGGADALVAGARPDSGSQVADAGAPPAASGNASLDATDVRWGSAAADDSCKYDLAFSTTPITRGADVEFPLTATSRDDAAFVGGAQPVVEVTPPTGTPLPTSGQQWSEDPGGFYRVGPVRFDEPGRWRVTVRLFPQCSTLGASPRAQATFWLDVP